jgi:hypothetical protein
MHIHYDYQKRRRKTRSVTFSVVMSFLLSSFLLAYDTTYFMSYGQQSGIDNIEGLQRSSLLTANSSGIITSENTMSTRILNISNMTGHSHFPQVYSFENYVYVLWEETMQNGSEVLFARSSDHGNTFQQQKINLSNDTLDSINPRLFTSGNNIYVVWESRQLEGSGEILFTQSSDNGVTFTRAINLSNDTGDSEQPEVTSQENNVYVVWEDIHTVGPDNILYTQSIDGGQTFGRPINISNNTGDSTDPLIASQGNNVYLVWADNSVGDYDIIFRRSTNNGTSFEDTINLSTSSGNSVEPSLAIQGDNVYVVWKDFLIDNAPSAEIVFARSTNGGSFFDKPLNISNTPGGSGNPEVGVFRNYLYIVWEDTSTGNSDIYFIRSVDEGHIFEHQINLSNNYGESIEPRIAVGTKGKVNVVWSDDSGANGLRSDIFFTESSTAGASFRIPKNIGGNEGGGDAVHPDVSAARADTYVVWEDRLGTGAGGATNNTEILFSVLN